MATLVPRGPAVITHAAHRSAVNIRENNNFLIISSLLLSTRKRRQYKDLMEPVSL